MTHWRRRPVPPTVWTTPSGEQEPFRAPTREEARDALGQLGCLPKRPRGRLLDDDLLWQLTKLLTWLAFPDEMQKVQTPRGMASQFSIDCMRWVAFCQGLNAVGWSGAKAGAKAGAWAAEKSRGQIYEGSAHTMLAAYKEVQRRLGQEQRRPRTYRPNRT